MADMTGGKGESVELLTSIDVTEEAALLAAPFRVELVSRRGPIQIEFDPMGWEDSDYAYRAKNQKPKPRATRELVRDPNILRLLGETAPVVMREYDLRDDSYLLEQERWTDGRAFHVVASCLTTELREGATPIGAVAGKIAALRKLGVTSTMACQLFQLIEREGLVRDKQLVGFSEAGSDPKGDAA